MMLTLPLPRSSMATPPSPDHCCSDWDQFFQLIMQFKQREGHCNAPIHHLESGKKLWIWLMVQNIHLKQRTMDSGRKHLLESLGINWNPQAVVRFMWDFKFLLLLQFEQQEGHLTVPSNHDNDGQNLGRWISIHLGQKKAGTRRSNEIGFIWNMCDVKWDAMFRALTQFEQGEGHVNVSDQHVECLDGGAAKDKFRACWLMNQLGCRTLDAKREKQLESMGVKWNCKRQDIVEKHFDSNFDLLLQFEQQEGHLSVPSNHDEDGQNLGRWISGQRGQKKSRDARFRKGMSIK
jgi:hypothetical protein